MEVHEHPRAALVAKAIRYGVALFIIVSLNFLLPRLMPGDPVMNIIGEEAFYGSAETLDELRVELGLDGPLHAQYGTYLADTLRGDLGYSYLYRRPVLEAVSGHLVWTLLLVLPSVLFGALIAAFFGSLAAWFRGSRRDAGFSAVFLGAYAMPHYWLAMLVLSVFSFKLGWFPLGKVSSGGLSDLPYIIDVLWHLVLPLGVLTVFKAAYDFLVVRNSLVAIYGEDYILMAQAKGLSGMAVLFKHALRNALAPLVTVTAIQFGMIMSGALLVEVVFSWPGMGTLIYDGIAARDYPLLQAAFLIIGLCVLLANLLADIVYIKLDPRTR
jgi:peptide/nickel transport system permease protein